MSLTPPPATFWSLRRLLLAGAAALALILAAGVLLTASIYHDVAMMQVRQGIAAALRFSLSERLDRTYLDWFGSGMAEISRGSALVDATQSSNPQRLQNELDELAHALRETTAGLNDFRLFDRPLDLRGVIVHDRELTKRTSASRLAPASAADRAEIRAALRARSPAERRQTHGVLWQGPNGQPMHSFIMPVGGFRALGYLEIVTAPYAVLRGIAPAMGGRLELIGPDDQALFSEGELTLAAPIHAAVTDTVQVSWPGYADTPWATVRFATDVTPFAQQIDGLVRRTVLGVAGSLLLLGLAAQFLMRRTVFRKLRSFAAAMTAVSQGTRDVTMPAVPADEFGEMARALISLSAAVEERDRATAAQRAMVDTLRSQTTELLLARDAAEAASRSKSQFLTSVSHELRTPLHAISGFAQLLEAGDGGPLAPTQEEYLRHILEAARHLGRLIDDILDLARIEAGGLHIELDPVDLRDLFEACRAALLPSARRAGVSLTFAPPTGETAVLLGDRTRLLQCLLNLGSNGVKYNRSGGKVRFYLENLIDGRLRICVEDDGIGIPAERRHELFQPFSRLGREQGTVQGTGVGLAITRALIERMGGAISYMPRSEGGSVFALDLPNALLPFPTARAAVPAPVDLAQRGGYAVLYVEDDPAHALLVDKLLSRIPDTRVVAAEGLRAGLAAAERHRPDLVLLDMNLPDGDGYDFLRELRAQPWGERVAVIAVSASASAEERARAELAGVVAFVAKPLKVSELFGAIHVALSARRTKL